MVSTPVSRTRFKLLNLFLTLLSLLGAAACTTSNKKIPPVTPTEAMGLIRNDFAVLVDVREESEVKEGMAEPAQWMPLGKIKANAPEWQALLAKTPKDKQIVFYCARGRRAGEAAELTTALGYKSGNMGGYSEWVNAKLPTRKP